MKDRMTTEQLKKHLTTWQHCEPDANITAWLAELIELREGRGVMPSSSRGRLTTDELEGFEYHGASSGTATSPMVRECIARACAELRERRAEDVIAQDVAAITANPPVGGDGLKAVLCKHVEGSFWVRYRDTRGAGGGLPLWQYKGPLLTVQEAQGEWNRITPGGQEGGVIRRCTACGQDTWISRR